MKQRQDETLGIIILAAGIIIAIVFIAVFAIAIISTL